MRSRYICQTNLLQTNQPFHCYLCRAAYSQRTNFRVYHFMQQTLSAREIPPNMMKQKPQIRELPMYSLRLPPQFSANWILPTPIDCHTMNPWIVSIMRVSQKWTYEVCKRDTHNRGHLRFRQGCREQRRDRNTALLWLAIDSCFWFQIDCQAPSTE